jgi:nitric oxide reductase subunit B
MLPVGILQAWASIDRGTWYARSAEFIQSGAMQLLRWMRVPGDVLFAAGAVLFAWFVLGLLTGHSYEEQPQDGLRPPGYTKETAAHDQTLIGH